MSGGQNMSAMLERNSPRKAVCVINWDFNVSVLADGTSKDFKHVSVSSGCSDQLMFVHLGGGGRD